MGVLNNLINSIKDNFTMAEFNINGRMTVSSLRKQFKDAFGGEFRAFVHAQGRPECVFELFSQTADRHTAIDVEFCHSKIVFYGVDKIV